MSGVRWSVDGDPKFSMDTCKILAQNRGAYPRLGRKGKDQKASHAEKGRQRIEREEIDWLARHDSRDLH